VNAGGEVEADLGGRSLFTVSDVHDEAVEDDHELTDKDNGLHEAGRRTGRSRRQARRMHPQSAVCHKRPFPGRKISGRQGPTAMNGIAGTIAAAGLFVAGRPAIEVPPPRVPRSRLRRIPGEPSPSGL
jgi:hypothetical protein